MRDELKDELNDLSASQLAIALFVSHCAPDDCPVGEEGVSMTMPPEGMPHAEACLGWVDDRDPATRRVVLIHDVDGTDGDRYNVVVGTEDRLTGEKLDAKRVVCNAKHLGWLVFGEDAREFNPAVAFVEGLSLLADLVGEE